MNTSTAAIVEVSGGATSVDLDTATLASVGLNLTGANPTAPAAPNFAVGFDITGRTAGVLPTTFTYDSDAFAPFAGTIEHTGTVEFNGGGLVVGDFTIGFDGNRVDGGTGASGFFVASNTASLGPAGIDAILFDVGGPIPTTSTSSLTITGSEPTGGAALLVSPELAGVLGNAALTGATVGSARVDAIPEPSTSLLGLLALPVLLRRRH